MRFKIIFPTGYQVADIFNDNIDINVVLENGDVFFGTLFTISNLDYFCLLYTSDAADER